MALRRARGVSSLRRAEMATRDSLDVTGVVANIRRARRMAASTRSAEVIQVAQPHGPGVVADRRIARVGTTPVEHTSMEVRYKFGGESPICAWMHDEPISEVGEVHDFVRCGSIWLRPRDLPLDMETDLVPRNILVKRLARNSGWIALCPTIEAVAAEIIHSNGFVHYTKRVKHTVIFLNMFDVEGERRGPADLVNTIVDLYPLTSQWKWKQHIVPASA